MKSLKNYITKHPLRIFFSLVFTISWVVVFLLAAPGGFPVTPEKAVTLGIAILLGPLATSFIMTALISGFRDLLSRLVRWRVNFRWYALAILIAPLLTIVTLAALALFSTGFRPNIFLSDDPAGLINLAIIAGFTVALCEELGWTGIAAPIMTKRYGIMKNGIYIGLLWGMWHFPLFWEPQSFTSMTAFALLLARLFSWLPPYRVLMVWVYQNTQSLLIVILMHFSLVSTLLIFDPILQGTELLIFILVRALLLWAAAIILVRQPAVITGK